MIRKLVSIALALMLLLTLTIPALAAQEPTVTLKASKTKLAPGDTLNITASITELKDCKTGGFLFEYDEKIFDYVDGKSLAGLKGFFAGVSTAGGNVAGFFMNGMGSVKGDLFQITLKVRDGVSACGTVITGTPSITVGDEKISCGVEEAQVEIVASKDGAATGDKKNPTVPKETTPDGAPATTTEPIVYEGAQIGDGATESVKPSEPKPMTGTTGATGGTGTTGIIAGNDDGGTAEFPWWILAVIALVALGGGAYLFFEIRRTKK